MANKAWNQVRYGWEDWFLDEVLGIPSEAIQIKAANLRDSKKGPVLELPPEKNLFDATLKDSEEATREADLKGSGEVVLPGTGDRRTLDTSLWGDKKGGTSLTQKVAEIPKGPNFTKTEAFAYNRQAAGKGSVAKNRAQLKQWQFEQNQQRSVAGLQNQPTNSTQPTNTTADPMEPDYNPGDAIPGDERADWKPGVMHEWNTDMEIEAKAQPVSGGMSAGNAMAVKAGVALLQEALGPKKEEKITMPVAQSTEIPWLKEEEDKLKWMSWVA